MRGVVHRGHARVVLHRPQRLRGARALARERVRARARERGVRRGELQDRAVRRAVREPRGEERRGGLARRRDPEPAPVARARAEVDGEWRPARERVPDVVVPERRGLGEVAALGECLAIDEDISVQPLLVEHGNERDGT